MKNSSMNFKKRRIKQHEELRDPKYRQRREPGKRIRLNEQLEREANEEIRQAKKT
jgi:hypothetical protein